MPTMESSGALVLGIIAGAPWYIFPLVQTPALMVVRRGFYLSMSVVNRKKRVIVIARNEAPKGHVTKQSAKSGLPQECFGCSVIAYYFRRTFN